MTALFSFFNCHFKIIVLCASSLQRDTWSFLSTSFIYSEIFILFPFFFNLSWFFPFGSVVGFVASTPFFIAFEKWGAFILIKLKMYYKSFRCPTTCRSHKHQECSIKEAFSFKKKTPGIRVCCLPALTSCTGKIFPYPVVITAQRWSGKEQRKLNMLFLVVGALSLCRCLSTSCACKEKGSGHDVHWRQMGQKDLSISWFPTTVFFCGPCARVAAWGPDGDEVLANTVLQSCFT